MSKYLGRRLGALLIEEGLCPVNASAVELHVPASGAVTLHYDVFVVTEDLPKLARALTRLAEQDDPPHE